MFSLFIVGCPPSVVPEPDETTENTQVPNVIGMTQSQATSTITGASLTVGAITMENSATVPRGNVISQSPVSGTTVQENTPVRLVLSSGPMARSVPNLIGATRAEAEDALESAGLTIGTVTMQFSDTIPPGEIISQSPEVGASAATGGTVTLVISLGPVVTVPNIVGQSTASAIDVLTNAGLVTGAVTLVFNDTVPPAQVLSQNPAPGANVAANSRVDMVVSKGLEPIAVPELVGLTRTAAEALLASTGFTTGVVTEVFSETIPNGQVISQSPEAGETLPPDSAVSITVSKGPEPTTVPAVVGLPRSTAEAAILNADLTIGTVTEIFSDNVPAGQVISQSPVGNTSAPKGTAVSLVVSKGVEMIVVPNVVGLTQSVAQTTITSARLSVGTITEQFHDTIPLGSVVSQSPTASTNISVGASVNLVISKGPESSEITVVVGSAGDTVELDLATLVVPSAALDENVEITMSRNRRGEQVTLSTNEQAVSQVYTIETGGALSIPSSGGKFSYSLAYDESAIDREPTDPINDTTLYLRVTTAVASFRLAGIVSGGTIQIPFDTLPVDAAVQIVYNPNMREVYSDPAAGKTLTQNPAWRTTRFRATYDVASAALLQAVAEIRETSVNVITESHVAETVRETAANAARDAALFYEDLGIREANLRVTGAGASAFMDLHIGSFSADSHFVDQGITWGQFNLDSSRLVASADEDFLGTARNAIAHDLFHACLDGYDLNLGPNNGFLIGLTESLATLLGSTLDSGELSVFPNVQHSLSDTIGDLGVTCDETACAYSEADAYALADWFVYLARRFNNETLGYLGGNGTFADGLLEQIRTQANQEAPADPGEAMAQLLLAMNAALDAQFGQPLSEVYWDYARNRAYEHNDESRLRATDVAARFSLTTGLFNAQHINEYTMNSDEQIVTIAATDAGPLRNIPPLTTRALIFRNNGNFNSDILLTFNQDEWEPDEFGNSMLVKVYKDGYDGVELPFDENEIFLTGFGDPDADPAFSSVVVLLSNVSVDRTYSVAMRANTTVATGGIGSLLGRATNADTDAPLGNMQVEVRGRNYGDSDAVIATTTTDGNGQFTLTDLPSGYVEMTFIRTGFVTTIHTATVESDTTSQINPSIIVEGQATEIGSATGRVIDTVNGNGVGGVSLTLRSGILQLRDTDYPVVTTVTTDSSGNYAFNNIGAGTYTVYTSRTGYINDSFVIYIVGGETRSGQDGDVSQTVNIGEIRIVLTWGENPSDLDSHLTGPLSGGGRFHVYFANPAAGNSDLDLDDVTSFGPETTTIHSRIPGTYRFSVHDFTNGGSSTSRAMSNSGTNVKVLTDSGLVEFNITPNTPATLWTVFEIDGVTGAITEVNEYSFADNSGSIPGPALDFRYPLGSESPTIVKDLPAKP